MKKKIVRTPWRTVRGLISNDQYRQLVKIGRKFPANHRGELLDTIRCAYLHGHVPAALQEIDAYFKRSLKIWPVEYQSRLVSHHNEHQIEQTTGFFLRLKRQVANGYFSQEAVKARASAPKTEPSNILSFRPAA